MRFRFSQLMKPVSRSYIVSKNINKRTICVYFENNGIWYEILRFKKFLGSFYLTYPYLTDEIFYSVHLIRIKNNPLDSNIDNFHKLVKLLSKIGFRNIFIIIGDDIDKNDLEKIIPKVFVLIPSLNISKSSIG